MAPNFELSGLDGTNGFKLNGEAFMDFSGRSVAAAGDVNGDGFGDAIVGDYRASPGEKYSGEAHVVFGGPGGFASDIELSLLNGTDGFRIVGAAAYDRAGFSVAGGCDINGDGFDDLIIGAEGKAYVIYGKASGFEERGASICALSSAHRASRSTLRATPVLPMSFAPATSTETVSTILPLAMTTQITMDKGQPMSCSAARMALAASLV